MTPSELYLTVRNEILVNHILVHVLTLVVSLVLLFGVWVVETRRTILSLFLPLLALSWAAAMIRFDLFIHRQGAYLRELELHISRTGSPFPLWETWKASLLSTKIVVPL